MAVTFTKLKSGEWGLRVEGTAKPGDLVTVSKKDGSKESKMVGKIIWNGNGITLCTIAAAAYTPQAGKRRDYDDCDDFCQGCRKCS